jgi:hypothetical protein
LFIPQVIYKYGEPWLDDDTGWEKLLTCPPEFSGNPTSRDIWDWVGGMDEEVRNLPCKYFVQTCDFYMPFTKWNLRLYFPSEGRCAADFYRP